MAQTIVELFEEQVHRSSVRTALRHHRDGMWEELTWTEWWDASERVAGGLIAAGVERGEKVCLLSSTRLEWVVVDMGLAMIGAVCIPLHAATSSEELADILEGNQIQTVLVEDPVQLGKVAKAGKKASSLQRVVYFDDDVLVEAQGRSGSDYVSLKSMALPSDLELESLDEVLERGRSALASEPRYVARRRRGVDADTVATILYTAGVSDRPRGVVLTHANLTAQTEALSALHLFSSDDVQLLFLPLAHIFARVLYLAAVGYGMTTVFGRGAEALVDDLAEVEPTLMASVPRVYQRLQSEIEERIRRHRLRSHLLPVALEVGKAVSRRTRGGDRVGLLLGWEHRLFSHLLLEDVRQWLGGNMRFLISGGAPLDQETCEFFFSAGVLLLEGYGLTETSGAVSFNMPDEFRFGTVGKPLPGVDVTIAEDGEVLVRGKTVMRRYLDDHSEEVRGLDADGWLHTGDIGHFDRDGFLHLTDRKRNVVITSTGKHVVPGGIERALCEHPLVAHALLVGEGRPFLGALVALDPDGILDFVDRHDLDDQRPVRELTGDPRIRQELRAHVDDVNRERTSYEHVRRFAVLPEFLSTRNRTLTSSGTVRRSEVLRRFGGQVEALFERGQAATIRQ